MQAETGQSAVQKLRGKVTLAELEAAAEALAIRVTYEDLKRSRGGSCRVLETRRIIISKHLSTADKINLLARELGAFDLSNAELTDRVLRKIHQEADHRPAA
jgi:hypothetical protein